MRHICLISLVVLLGVGQTTWAKPTAPPRNLGIHRREDKPPRLEDTLAVAKSPLEPITVSIGLPDARFDDSSRGSEIETTVGLDLIRKTTRSSQDDSHAENGPVNMDTSPVSTEVSPVEGSSVGPQESSSVSSSDAAPAKSEEPQELTTTTEAPVSKPSTVDTTTPDAPATHSGSDTEPTTQAPADESTATTTTTTTTTTPAPTTIAAVEPSSVAPEVVSETAHEQDAPKDMIFSIASTTTTTTVAPEPTTVTTEETSTITTTTASPISEEPAEPAGSSTESPETSSPKEEPSSPATIQPSTEGPTTKSPPAASEEPAVGTSKPESEPVQTGGVEKEEPVAAVEQPSVPAIESASVSPVETTSVTPSSTTTTEKPVETATSLAADEDAKDESHKKVVDCSHLPTYSSEEVQKVFREETTFNNGTIKGKFTYINYDQRYRLVHYTRLPYGPVKIDLVEELGRPRTSQAGPNQSASYPTTNEVPNAVLQLRNILPNSLFGFPFLNPNSGYARQNGLVDTNDDRASNMYFYSTDTLSTPNLLTPSVPVSVPFSHRIKQTTTQAGAMMSNPLNQAIHQDQSVASKQHQEANSASFGLPSTSLGQQIAQERRQFLYASPQAQPEQVAKPMVYTYLSPANQYQYAPQPLYQAINPHHHQFHSHQQYHNNVHHSLHDQQVAQPRNFANHPNEQTSQLAANKKEDPEPVVAPLVGHHQPHSHEHYVAPFMFSQPPSGSANNPTEGSKIRLRVKSSKSLNYSPEQGSKSAQLRAPQGSINHSAPANSPAQVYHRQQARQRAGKLNQELRVAPVNSSPVVYHVLRNPGGQVYTLPQYNQNYAVAYDRDN